VLLADKLLQSMVEVVAKGGQIDQVGERGAELLCRVTPWWSLP
jgi:hypothetical protein